MIIKDDFNFFCEDNGIIIISSVVEGTSNHLWVMKYPNDEVVEYNIPKIGQTEEYYAFRENLYKDAKIKIRQIKIWKLSQKNK